MKNLKQFQKQIKQRIELAADKERVSFGLDICKRLLSEYRVFAAPVNLSDIRVLDESLYAFENYVRYNTLNLEYILTLINKADLIKLNTDDFSDVEKSYAINALASVCELLLYLGDNDYEHISAISDLMTKTIEFKILDENANIPYEEVDSHPLLINEFSHQLDFLKDSD